MCNSTHSRLLGFFTTLPGIWRALQCMRRYYDTRAVFPHLANCGKYMATILYYLTLSIYRIQESYTHLAVFITFATLNAVYTCKFVPAFVDDDTDKSSHLGSGNGLEFVSAAC